MKEEKSSEGLFEEEIYWRRFKRFWC